MSVEADDNDASAAESAFQATTDHIRSTTAENNAENDADGDALMAETGAEDTGATSAATVEAAEESTVSVETTVADI